MITITDLNLYNKEAAINHVKTLAFKRRASTKGETKTINYILQELNKGKLEPKEETFLWAGTLNILMRLAFVFLFCWILLYQIILLFPNITWLILPLDLLLIVIILYGVKYIFDLTRISYTGKRNESKNVIATVQAKDLYPKRPVIIFSAHHDSVSLKYSMVQMIFLYVIGALLFLVFLLITLFLSIWSFIAFFRLININEIYFLIRNIILIIGIIIQATILIILLNKKTNESIGSVDNATGVAVLLELAKLIKKNPLERIDVIFLWCGAEEFGLWGSRQYLTSHLEELEYDYDLNKSYNINFDMIGTYIGLVDKTGLIKKKNQNENLNDVIDAAANKQNIPLKRVSIPIGASSDHQSFHQFLTKAEKNGFQVCCFNSSKDTKYIHSNKDTIDLCSSENLNGCIEICFNAIKSLDLRVG